jgi:hypothetical protein
MVHLVKEKHHSLFDRIFRDKILFLSIRIQHRLCLVNQGAISAGVMPRKELVNEVDEMIGDVGQHTA